MLGAPGRVKSVFKVGHCGSKGRRLPLPPSQVEATSRNVAETCVPQRCSALLPSSLIVCLLAFLFSFFFLACMALQSPSPLPPSVRASCALVLPFPFLPPLPSPLLSPAPLALRAPPNAATPTFPFPQPHQPNHPQPTTTHHPSHQPCSAVSSPLPSAPPPCAPPLTGKPTFPVLLDLEECHVLRICKTTHGTPCSLKPPPSLSHPLIHPPPPTTRAAWPKPPATRAPSLPTSSTVRGCVGGVCALYGDPPRIVCVPHLRPSSSTHPPTPSHSQHPPRLQEDLVDGRGHLPE